MKQKELSIIIVNYNGKLYLDDCFHSIKKYCSSIDFEIIVWDNNSQDDSVKHIEKHYPETKLIKSKVNLGFGMGNNGAVLTSTGKNILLLNNDTVLLSPIKPLLEYMEKPSVGAVGIKMLGEGMEFRKSVGKFPSILRLIKLSKLYYSSPSFKHGVFHKDLYPVDWIEGSFLMTKREVWDKVGGFDNRFFMYVEDVDLCKSIKDLGLENIFIPKYCYIHYGGFNKKRESLLLKGHEIFVNKHYHGLYRILCLISLRINKMYKRLFKNMKI